VWRGTSDMEKSSERKAGEGEAAEERERKRRVSSGAGRRKCIVGRVLVVVAGGEVEVGVVVVVRVDLGVARTVESMVVVQWY
jgi:hypothetical protein